jgi:hypothetical protein
MPQNDNTKRAKEAAQNAFQEIRIASNQLVDKVRELIDEGNVRHIRIVREGKTLLEVPLTVGVGAGAAALFLSPVLAAVGALAALVGDITLQVERDEDVDLASPAQADKAGSAPASKPVTDAKGKAAAEDKGDKSIGK